MSKQNFENLLGEHEFRGVSQPRQLHISTKLTLNDFRFFFLSFAQRVRNYKLDLMLDMKNFLYKSGRRSLPPSYRRHRKHRSHSPNSPRSGSGNRSSGKSGHGDDLLGSTKPVQDLAYHVRQVKNALTHFKDVILKNKLEMLPGNGTVVLELIANVHTGEYAISD